MNIDSFKGAFDNLAKPTLFQVSGMGADRKMEFLCKGVQIPAGTIGIIEIPHKGRKIKIPGDRTYADWTITIINDNDFTLRTFFEQWQERINGAETNVGSLSNEAVKSDAFVSQLDASGKVVAQYQIVGAWPNEVSAIELNADSTDTVEEFTVTLAFDYWQRTK